MNLTFTDSTISGNVAPTGRSIFNGNEGAAQTGDTILNAGVLGGTISNQGTVTSLGYNIASDVGGGVLTGFGDQINTDQVLGPLRDDGGATFTHALLRDRPAISAGDPNFTGRRQCRRHWRVRERPTEKSGRTRLAKFVRIG